MKLVEPYIQALLREMKLYESALGRLQVPSVYIGGGTPTLLAKELEDVLGWLKTHFELTGNICIEAGPADIDDELLVRLKRCGVSQVSIGVQSFNDRHLRLLGRNYTSDSIEPNIRKLIAAGFSSVNVDLMFALPLQKDQELLDDLRTALTLDVDQITTYPLFTFPYSRVGRYRKLRGIKMPNLFTRRRQYYLINDFLRSNGYSRVSVWGFKKDGVPKYSSVTRDGYIGFGAGAGSDTTNGFYLNTFSVSGYIDRCLSGGFPTALRMTFNEKMKNYFWLYWRLYDTSISNAELYRRFGSGDKKLKHVIKALKFLRLAEERNDNIVLNDSGSFWVHLLQNYFVLNYHYSANSYESLGTHDLKCSTFIFSL
jgi:oxygen-independent coproporphyrinogen-3 oxidase